MTSFDKDNSRQALVLGATGGIGGAIASALVRHGWHVRAMVRNPRTATEEWKAARPAPQFVSGDAMNREQVVSAATSGGNVAAIVHAVNPPGYRDWDKLVLPMLDNTLAAARAAGGARVVLPGTVYNYDAAATPLIDENTPQNARTRKGRIRVAMEAMLRAAAPGVPALILRAGDFFGPGTRSSWFAQAMVTPGKPLRKVISLAPGVPHAYAYLPNLAETFALLMKQPERLERFEVLQFAGHWDDTGSAMRDAVRRAVGCDLPERGFPWWMMRLAAPFGGFPKEAIEIEPVWKNPTQLDNRRLVTLLGSEPHTDLDLAVTTTLIELGCLDGGRSAPLPLVA